MRVDIVTLFAPMFDALTKHGISGRAFERQLVQLKFWNPRDYVQTQYKSVDDRPYGGGPGMVMMAAPLAQAIDAAAIDQMQALGTKAPVIYLSPQGAPATQKTIERLLKNLEQVPAITLLCGRYEGIDERLIESRVTEEISMGDLVVSGGELPAMMLLDALIRWLPGALNDERSAPTDSFVQGLLDHPHYTRPEVFEGQAVPEQLIGGHHLKIEQWRRLQALLSTAKKRPDLMAQAVADGTVSEQEWRQIRSML
jgi:tRNA (guanine37-N1)-methyltransferase